MKTGIGNLSRVYSCGEFGRIWHNRRYTLVMSLSETAGNGAKKNIPCDCHGMFNIPGGDEGIRTLDTLAGIPHFQCGALDQLCDISWCSNIFYSADMSAVSSVSDGSTGFSINVSSSSASISRNFGSSVVVISKDSSSFGVIGDSL